jgi:hypothetical protein
MLFRKKIAIYCENHTEHTNTLCGQDAKFCDVKASGKKERQIYLCNRPWRTIGLWEVEALAFSRQSAHRWRWGCQSYAPAAVSPQEGSWYSFLLEANSTPGP